MQINLTELKSSIPAEVLDTILLRAVKQVKDDAQQYHQAIKATDYGQAAQLIHRMRGLALFLGVTEAELMQLHVLEDELAACSTENLQTPLGIAVFSARFDVFRASFESALLNVGDATK
jgi:hypothetical protein